MIVQLSMDIPLPANLADTGESTSPVVNAAKRDTPATAGDVPTIPKPADTAQTSQAWTKPNTKTGNYNAPNSAPLPAELLRCVCYALTQQAVEAFLFVGPGLLRTVAGDCPVDLDTGTWLCVRFIDIIPDGTPGEVITITPEDPRR